MKKNVDELYQRKTGFHPIIATMAEESMLRRTNWIRHGCNYFDAKTPKSAPLSFWTEQDVLKYLKLKNIPIAKVYGDIEIDLNGKYYTTGCKRTGCMFCMFGIMSEKEPNRFQRMYFTHPKQWKYCMDKLGIREVMDFLGKPVDPNPDLFNYKEIDMRNDIKE